MKSLDMTLIVAGQRGTNGRDIYKTVADIVVIIITIGQRGTNGGDIFKRLRQRLVKKVREVTELCWWMLWLSEKPIAAVTW